jgi:hypothetical protein
MVSTSSVILKGICSTYWSDFPILDCYINIHSADDCLWEPPEKVGRHREYPYRIRAFSLGALWARFQSCGLFTVGSLIPHRIDPISVPNNLIRCDERAAKLPGAGNNGSVGGIADGTQ